MVVVLDVVMVVERATVPEGVGFEVGTPGKVVLVEPERGQGLGGVGVGDLVVVVGWVGVVVGRDRWGVVREQLHAGLWLLLRQVVLAQLQECGGGDGGRSVGWSSPPGRRRGSL